MEIQEIENLFKDPSIHKFAISLCRDKTLAEDLVMDVVTKLIEKVDTLNDDTNLVSYAITAIKRQHIDYRRRLKTRGTEISPEDETLKNQNQLRDDKASSAIQAPMELQQALDKLNESCRELLVKFGQGFTYEELAQNLDIKIGTVMSRMSRCRDSLSNEMGLS